MNNGMIVRPTETGGSADILRDFDFEIGGFTPAALERAQHSKATYMAAVEDWARKGSDSQFVYSPGQAAARMPQMTRDQARAHTLFRLGTHLQHVGRDSEAQALFLRCRELHPDSWNIFRQTTDKLENGIAASEQYWQKVSALGDRPYYEAIDLPGIDD